MSEQFSGLEGHFGSNGQFDPYLYEREAVRKLAGNDDDRRIMDSLRAEKPNFPGKGHDHDGRGRK